jgi:hypothetical protein
MKGNIALQTRRSPWLKYFLLGSMILLIISPRFGHAEVIDRVQINRAGDEAEIRIQFVTRVQYLRQVMLRNGDVRIYFNLVERDATDPNLVRQQRVSPPSNIVSRFTVTYPEIDSSLTISFGKPVDYHIRPGSDGRSISFFTPVLPGARPEPVKLPETHIATSPSPVPETTPLPSAPRRGESASELNELAARQLMQNAIAVQQRNLTLASIALLNKLLALPTNSQSQTALAMRARAYEATGDFDKARLDYLAYMKLYPKSPDYKQMEDGVARMIMAAYNAKKSVPERMDVSDKMITFGGFSQYYSKGLVQIDSIASATSVQTSTYTSDQSQLQSSLDLTGIKTTASRETRMVFRDTFTANFLRDGGSSNFLDAAYIEQSPNDQSYYYGAGRQIGGSGGIPGRFDGLWLGSNLSEAWRISATFGQPVRPAGSDAEPKLFAAAGIKLTRLPGQWSGNTYLISQRVAAIIDRRAMGLEAHYDDEKRNHTIQVEYDTLFRRASVGLFQGNWITDKDDNFTLLVEHRRSMQITNALNRLLPPEEISRLLAAGATPASLRADALLASPAFNQVGVGLTHPYSEHIKFGGDFNFSNTTAYEYYNFTKSMVDVMPRVGASTLSLQVVGNNLLLDNDLGVAKASYTDATTYQAKSLTFSQTETFLDKWRLDIAVQVSSQRSDISGEFNRVNPSLKLSYRSGASMYFEFGAGLEQSHNIGTFLVNGTDIYQEQDNRSRRKYFNLGYRWDFR